MPRLTWEEHSLLQNLDKIINNITNHHEYRDEYLSIVHQLYDIFQRKYKFNLKDHYIGAEGDIFSRPATTTTTESINQVV